MIRTASISASHTPSFFASVPHAARATLLLAAAALVLSACASAETEAPPDDAPPPTVRERLATSTDLFVSPTMSGGAITARRWTDSGWDAGDVPITIDTGAIVAQVAPGTGSLSIATVDLLLAPIDLPYPDHGVAARLDRLKLDLDKAPLVTPLTWSATDEAAHASTQVDLVLSWAVDIDGVETMLGPQHLPPIPVDIAITGNGDSVLASLTLDLTGTVWGWAGLIDLRDLRLVIETASD